jgi:ketopantoate hydroxymethyltransferase
MKVANREPITMLTCFDYPIVDFQDHAVIDMIWFGMPNDEFEDLVNLLH